MGDGAEAVGTVVPADALNQEFPCAKNNIMDSSLSLESSAADSAANIGNNTDGSSLSSMIRFNHDDNDNDIDINIIILPYSIIANSASLRRTKRIMCFSVVTRS